MVNTAVRGSERQIEGSRGQLEDLGPARGSGRSASGSGGQTVKRRNIEMWKQRTKDSDLPCVVP